MGITGLLPLLRDVTHEAHIGEYRGKVAGIDAFCWLHRGAFTCGTELVLGRPTDKCVACVRACVDGRQACMHTDCPTHPTPRSPTSTLGQCARTHTDTSASAWSACSCCSPTA